MDPNYFATRDQSIFITYMDMIKLAYPCLLHELINDYYDDLKEHLELDKIKHFDIYNLERICAERIHVNPLVHIKKPECSVDTCNLLLDTFINDTYKMYIDSHFSEFGNKMQQILSMDNIKNVYIYIEQPAEQIIVDCNVYFSKFSKKIKYLTGDFIHAVQCTPVKPTCYVLNDVNYVHKLIEHKYIAYTEILLGEIGCNFELDDNLGLKIKGIDEKVIQDNIFKIAITPIVNLEKKHFTQFDMSELDKK